MKVTNRMAARLRELILKQGYSPNHARVAMLREVFDMPRSTTTIYNHIEHGDIGIRHGQPPVIQSQGGNPGNVPGIEKVKAISQDEIVAATGRLVRKEDFPFPERQFAIPMDQTTAYRSYAPAASVSSAQPGRRSVAVVPSGTTKR